MLYKDSKDVLRWTFLSCFHKLPRDVKFTYCLVQLQILVVTFPKTDKMSLHG